MSVISGGLACVAGALARLLPGFRHLELEEGGPEESKPPVAERAFRADAEGA